MACFHPKKGFIVGLKDNDMFDIRITPYQVDHLEEMPDGSMVKCYQEFVSKQNVRRIHKSFIEIGCGKCIGCRLDKAKIWKERCLSEMLYHKNALFLTLTYDNEHLPWASDDDSDEAYVYNSLRKKDLQDFWKRLRKNSGQEIRYFACGEYGSKTWRPHYHAIVYDLELDDLQPHGQNENGQPLLTSEKLNKWWHNGFVIVGSATKESIEYVARYTCKKAYDETRDQKIKELGIEPEFIVMSKRPAIGKAWYDDNYQYIDHFGHAYIGLEDGSHYVSNNDYYKKKKVYSSLDEKIADKHKAWKAAKRKNDLMTSQIPIEYLDQLAKEEESLKKKKVAKMRDF